MGKLLIGIDEVSKLYIGTDEVSKLYIGNDEVWSGSNLPSWLPTNGLEKAINTLMPNRGQYYTDFAFHYSQGTNNKSYAYVRAWSTSQMDVQIVLDRGIFIFLQKNPKDFNSSFTEYTLEYDMKSNTWGYGSDGYQPHYYATIMATNSHPVDKYACVKTTETSVVNNSGLPFEMLI